jgi:ABC-type Mn2+/Zn2+ transport system ATPase subunit
LFQPAKQKKLENIIELLFEHKKASILNKNIQELSEGQKMLVSIARALYSDKEYILLDEPNSSTDSEVSKKILNAILKSDKTVIAVLHHQVEEWGIHFDKTINLSC